MAAMAVSVCGVSPGSTGSSAQLLRMQTRPSAPHRQEAQTGHGGLVPRLLDVHVDHQTAVLRATQSESGKKLPIEYTT